MSDSFQTLAFDTVGAGDAPTTVDSALSWMKAAGYILADLEICVHGADGLGFRPGPNWQRIVDGTRSWRGRTKLVGVMPPPDVRPHDIRDFLTLTTNGVSSVARRIVCDSGENWSTFKTGICPSCSEEVTPQIDIFDAAGEWFEGRVVTVPCPHCSVVSQLEAWDFQPYWAFAESALIFWNWPSLSENFTRELTNMFGIPRLRHIVGHL
jgi:hypothetical protein